MKKFFFSPRTNYENAGDALINRELLRILRGYGEIHASRSGHRSVFSMKSAWTQRNPLRNTPRPRAAAFAAGIRRGFGEQPPFMILAPGDPSGPIDAGLLVRSIFFALLALAGVRLVRLGVSFSRMSPARLRLEAITSRLYYFSGARTRGHLHWRSAAALRTSSISPTSPLPCSRPKASGESTTMSCG